MVDSKIEWCHATFNPWWGCTKVSPGCKNCYADSLAKRYGHEVWGPTSMRRAMSEAYWKQPLKWNRDAQAAGVRRRVFCASMADVFEGPETCQDPIAYRIIQDARRRLFAIANETKWLDWQFLTKRPQNIEPILSETLHLAYPHTDWWTLINRTPRPNWWFGTSVENQATADERIPHLLRCPAAVRFLSCEPLLEPVTLRSTPEGQVATHIRTWLEFNQRVMDGRWSQATYNRVDWVIAGGESGPGARACQVEWLRGIIRQCKAASVPVFVKQLGACYLDDKNGVAGASLKVPPEATPLISRRLRDRKGGDMDEWPENLRIRQFPGDMDVAAKEQI